MAGAALRSLYFCIISSILFISLSMGEEENQFFYQRFYPDPQLRRDGLASVLSNGLLQLTNRAGGDGGLRQGHAFYPFPIKFNTSFSQSLSFSTYFVFAIVPAEYLRLGGHGIAFVIAPSADLWQAEIRPAAYLGLFNSSTNGQSTNHILAIELDTVQSIEFNDINDNHVGIDINSLISNASAPATYFSDEEGINKSLDLKSGDSMQIWIDYRGAEKLLNVTLAPITVTKPQRPLLSTSIDLSQILLDTMYVGFSSSTGVLESEHYILGWSFNTSGKAQSLDISSLPQLPQKSPSPSSVTKASEKRIIIVSLLAVVVVLITISVSIYLFRRKKYQEVLEDWEREYGPQRFSYKNLYKATKGFNDKEVIGKGGFGKVYRGVLPSNEQIAVKRVSHDSKQGIKEFVAEVVSMGRLRHRNLVKLRGYCRLRGEFLLVYDYMPNGSLDKILHGHSKPHLNWFQRFLLKPETSNRADLCYPRLPLITQDQ